MTSPTLPRILCVDDVPAVLTSISVTLRRDYEVHTATKGEDALKMLADNGAYAVICTDMRMPGMNGTELLKQVMHLYPEITRILFTGETGRETAANAVNEGQIFRFLTKPCPPEKLKAAMEAGVMHHRMVSAERVLLQETLIGCIKALIDVLAIANPVAFGRASRVKRLSKEFASDLGCNGFWQLDAAALLSQLGYLSLPMELVEKLYHGEPLTQEEKVLASGVPQVANKLLGNIPRLEPVLQILAGLNNPNGTGLPNGPLNLGTKVLSLVLDYDSLVARGLNASAALDQLRQQSKHGQELIEKLAARLGATIGREEIKNMPLRNVQPGMILMDELRNEFGTLLFPRGFEISEGFVSRMRSYGSKILSEEVRVMIRIGGDTHAAA
jgi:response regulator RpfG family c-di-GMP phosphodiesterase